ncbi:LysR family transcriptional regulator [Pigmentiphaga aceris]|uniref:LysR family transcriptional regulator n=1 Tax=Pigmentiphaga aceris TaxID=1940612 RepID=A0A5C0B759_9BURK|nr:LysR family transcriptional regulator [Pigmentiphaga aceris]QEI08871.1 LysR family transcriptional regulator [Pigmentiphaga aceris]
MSLGRLRTFIEVYRQRSLSAAARALHLTQPAVSQHIAGLEEAIGRSLFLRESTGVVPTAAADELAADIGDKLDAAEAALASARIRSEEMAGSIQIIGHADFLAEVVAAELVPLLEAGINVRLQTGGADMTTHMLIEGHCDLGISAYASTDKRLRSDLIRAEEVLVVAAPAVAARLQAAPDLADALAAEPLLAYNLELPLIDQWLDKNQLRRGPASPALIGQDLRTLRSLLTTGFGWTALPQYLCAGAIARGELMEITPPVARTSLSYHLIWSAGALRKTRVAHARQTILWSLGKRTAG